MKTPLVLPITFYKGEEMKTSGYFAVQHASSLLDVAKERIKQLNALPKSSAGQAEAKNKLIEAEVSLNTVRDLLGSIRSGLGPDADREIKTMERDYNALNSQYATLSKKLS